MHFALSIVHVCKQVVLEAEISREQIPLRNAYRHVGQKASVRVNSGVEVVLPGVHWDLNRLNIHASQSILKQI